MPPAEFEKRLNSIRDIFADNGIAAETREKIWMDGLLRTAWMELENTVRRQQGATFKFKRQGGRFVYTFCAGKLLSLVGLNPEAIVGKALTDVFPERQASYLREFYQAAWDGREDVACEIEINGVWCYIIYAPVWSGGRVKEVVGTCINLPRWKSGDA